ncbi:DMT family transporter [Candidatus Bipolaricaulota bacterium]
MTSSRSLLPGLAAALTGLLVGVALVATRSVAADIPPGLLALLRYSIGGLCLLPLVFVRRRVHVPWRDLLRIGLLGVLQFAVVVGLLNISLKWIPASRAALLFSLCPVLTLMLDSVLKRRRPPTLGGLGVVIALGGVVFVFGWQSIAGTASWSWIGDGAAVLSALSAAVCSVSYRPYLRRYGSITVALYAMPAAVFFLCLIAMLEGVLVTPLQLDLDAWMAIVFIGLSSGIGYLLWLWALKHASPTRITVFLTLNPVSAAGFGALFLGERVGVPYGIGLICVILGVWMAYRERTL